MSKRFHDYETRYTLIKKSYFALVWAIQKLRHIILPLQIGVVARMDPLKYLFEKPALSGRLSIWLILLVKFNLKYVARKMDVELGRWKMYFDEAINQCGNGIGILLITLEGFHMPLEIKLNIEATNNMAEYEACIAKMKALRELGVK